MKHRIKELDALRGIAACMVVIFHISLGIREASWQFNVGCMGVDLFFIISGFVILMTLEKCKNWKDFAVSRFSRLYPAYWVCVTITGIAWWSVHQIPVHDFIILYFGNMTMFQFYLGILHIDGVYWTLNVELLFYFLMLFLFLTKSLKHIEKIGLGLIAFIFLIRFNYSVVDQHPILQKAISALPLIRYFPLFFTGIIIYKIKFDRLTTARILIILACFLVQIYVFDKFYNNRIKMNFEEYAVTLLIIFSVFVLYLTNKLQFIVNGVTLWLGEISYSLYLIHQYIERDFILNKLLHIYHWNYELAAVVSITSVLIIATLINRLVEKPSLEFIRARYKQYKQNNSFSSKV